MQLKHLTPAEWPWPLLLESDPDRAIIETYIHQGTVMGLVDDGAVVAVVVLLVRDATTTEVMNMAVDPLQQGKGLGKYLLSTAIDWARAQGAQRMMLATGNSSIGPLAFYQKMGFRLESIDRDYFVRTYPDPIVENGIRCCDRVWLSLNLFCE